MSNDQHLDHFGISLTTFWSIGHIWLFYILWCTWLSKHTGEWNSIHVLLLIYVHEHRFLQTTFHHDLGKTFLGIFILNNFSIMSICSVGFSMIKHLLSSYITVLNTNAILAQVLQLKTISNEVLIRVKKFISFIIINMSST